MSSLYCSQIYLRMFVFYYIACICMHFILGSFFIVTGLTGVVLSAVRFYQLG